MKNTQRNQIIVKVKKEKECREFIEFLNCVGFENVKNISYQDLQVKVLIVDLDQFKFFPTNITCLAAAASVGKKAVEIEDFKCYVEENEFTI